MTSLPDRLASIRWVLGLGTLFSFMLLARPAEQSSAPFSIHWRTNDNDRKLFVEISGIDRELLKGIQKANWATKKWQSLLAVYADQGDLMADLWLPAMSGSYRVDSNAVVFKPQFPLERGVSYRAVFRPDELPGDHTQKRKAITSLFSVPKASSGSSSVVTKIYPTTNTVPENLLKFYVHFSAPMSRGDIYDYIHLRGENGKAIELPFLEINEELWDPAMMRLTLFIDPGRIKRGVKPLEDVGPALEAGKGYTLTIDRAWKDAAGNPLKADFQKRFKVGPPDRDPPDPAKWRIVCPKPGTADVLEVIFPEPLDHALARRMIDVGDSSGRPINGSVQLANDEREWRFVPEGAWRAGRYQLFVQNTLEDLAGNNIGKAFEVDLFERVQKQFTNSTIRVPFEIR